MPVKSRKPPESSASRERSGKAQTTYSKRMVRNCIAKLERDHGKQNLAFATYTLPDLPEAEMRLLSESWGKIANRLMEEIGRDQARAGIKPAQVYVNEIQESRYRQTGAIAPHIHVVFQSRKSRYHDYAISKERNTKLWNRILSNVLGREVEAPSGARVEQVKKSAEGYMSKYMSKGGQVAKQLIDEGKTSSLPKQWWGATLTLRQWVKSNIRLWTLDAQNFLKDNYKQFEDNLKQSPFKWLYVHRIKLVEPHGEEVEIPVAILGKLRPSWMDCLDERSLADAPMAWDW